MRGLGQAFAIYWEESAGHNPFFLDKSEPTSDWPPGVAWPWALRPYIGGENPTGNLSAREKNQLAFEDKMFNCPSAYKKGVWNQPEAPPSLPVQWTYPYGASYTVGTCSIGLNYFLSYYNPGLSGTGDFRYPRMDRLNSPAEVCLTLDTGRYFCMSGGVGSWSHHPNGNNCYDPRHLDEVNMLFVDGHIESKNFYWFFPWNYEAERALFWPTLLE